MTRIGDESVAGFDHGAKSSIGASALQLTATSVKAPKGVLVKASSLNTAGTYIYVGNSDVTANSADATDGFQLGVGEAVLVPIDDPSKIYVIGSTTGLKVFWMVA